MHYSNSLTIMNYKTAFSKKRASTNLALLSRCHGKYSLPKIRTPRSVLKKKKSYQTKYEFKISHLKARYQGGPILLLTYNNI